MGSGGDGGGSVGRTVNCGNVVAAVISHVDLVGDRVHRHGERSASNGDGVGIVGCAVNHRHSVAN